MIKIVYYITLILCPVLVTAQTASDSLRSKPPFQLRLNAEGFVSYHHHRFFDFSYADFELRDNAHLCGRVKLIGGRKDRINIVTGLQLRSAGLVRLIEREKYSSTQSIYAGILVGLEYKWYERKNYLFLGSMGVTREEKLKSTEQFFTPAQAALPPYNSTFRNFNIWLELGCRLRINDRIAFNINYMADFDTFPFDERVIRKRTIGNNLGIAFDCILFSQKSGSE